MDASPKTPVEALKAGLRAAACLLAPALRNYEIACASGRLDAVREAREDFLSAARCVVLSESSLQIAERTDEGGEP